MSFESSCRSVTNRSSCPSVTNRLKDGDQMDVVSPYSNGVPEDTPEDSPKQCEDNHRNREVGVANHRLKDVVSPSRNGIPKGLPNNSKSSHWNREVDEKQAEESLSLYCKPVELYNIIQQRSESQPLFLQRCLSYISSARLQRRIKMSMSVTNFYMGKSKGKEPPPSRSVFVMLTRPVTYPTEGQVMYRLERVQVLRVGGSLKPSATISYILPAVKILAEKARSGDVVLFVMRDSVDVGNGTAEAASFENCTGSVVWGKLAISSLCVNWMTYTDDGFEWKAPDGTLQESTLNVDLRPGQLQIDNAKEAGTYSLNSSAGRAIFAKPGKTIRLSTFTKISSVLLTVRISGAEVRHTTRKGKGKATNGTVPKAHLPYTLASTSVPVRPGRVVFHYLYCKGKFRKTEVTDFFSCPFCLTKCASFKGLESHLDASHDLFNFEYLVSGELQVVNVSCRPEVVGPQGNIRDVDGYSDPRVKNFAYWVPGSRSRRRRVPVSGGEHLQDGKLISLTRMLGASHLTEEPELTETSHAQQTADLQLQSVDTAPAPVPAPAPAVSANASEQSLGDSLPPKPSTKALIGVSIKGSRHRDSISLQQDLRKAQEADALALRKAQDALRKAQDVDGLALVVKQRSAPARKRQRMKGVLAEMTHVRSRPRPTFGGACASAGVRDLDDCGQQQGSTMACKSIVPDIPRTHALLQKRQYYHSHTAQPMDAEALFGDRDSEDELDSDVADLEDRRMLDDFVDVTSEEKEVMHLWNSFVRRNRVVADGHCPWACGEFSRENAQRFGENPALRRCLMLFLVKLWNHHLVDGSTISRCLAIVDYYSPKE